MISRAHKITPIRFSPHDLRLIDQLRYVLRGGSLASTVRFAIAEAHANHCREEAGKPYISWYCEKGDHRYCHRVGCKCTCHLVTRPTRNRRAKCKQ